MCGKLNAYSRLYLYAQCSSLSYGRNNIRIYIAKCDITFAGIYEYNIHKCTKKVYDCLFNLFNNVCGGNDDATVVRNFHSARFRRAVVYSLLRALPPLAVAL